MTTRYPSPIFIRWNQSPVFSVLILFGLAMLLHGCGAKGSAGMVRRINPPSASIQHLRIIDDNQLQLTLRLQNFSTVPTNYQDLQAQLTFNTLDAIQISIPLHITIPALSADVIDTTIQLQQPWQNALQFDYTLDGTINTNEPSGHYEFTYKGKLMPVPGVKNEFR